MPNMSLKYGVVIITRGSILVDQRLIASAYHER